MPQLCDHGPDRAPCLCANVSIGSASSCEITEKVTSAGMDLSYNRPMVALPANHAIPKPVSKKPKPVLRFSGGRTWDRTALRQESCAPMPIPQRTIPASSSSVECKKTNAAKKAGRPNATSRIGNPSLSSSLPSIGDAIAPVAIATA